MFGWGVRTWWLVIGVGDGVVVVDEVRMVLDPAVFPRFGVGVRLMGWFRVWSVGCLG